MTWKSNNLLGEQFFCFCIQLKKLNAIRNLDLTYLIELDAHEQPIQQLIFSSTRIHLHIILIKIYRQTQEKIGNVIKKDLHKFITSSMVHKIYLIKDTIRRNENEHVWSTNWDHILTKAYGTC